MHESSTIFERFLDEFARLLSALDQHVHDVEQASDTQAQVVGLTEIARLADALGALADAFEASDVALVGTALTRASALSASMDTILPVPLPGAHDALVYFRWRLAAMRANMSAGPIEPETRTIAGRLAGALAGESLAYGDTDLAALTPQDREILQSFSAATLRQRDELADAEALLAARRVDALRGEGSPAGSATDGELQGMASADAQRLFVIETEMDLQELSELIAIVGLTPEPRANFSAMSHIGHKIKGGAAMVGFPEFCEVATLFERTALALTTNVTTPSDFVRVTLSRFFELFEICLSASASHEPPPRAAALEAKQLFEAARQVADAETAPGDALQALADGEVAPISSGRHVMSGRTPHAEGLLHIGSDRLEALMIHLSALALNRGAIVGAYHRVTHAQREMGATRERLRDKSAHIADIVALTGAPGSSHGFSSGRTAPPPPAQAQARAIRREPDHASDQGRYTEADTAITSLTEVVADVEAYSATLSGALMQMGQLIEAQELLIGNLQQDATRMRLAPLSDLAPRLEILATLIASASGKRVRFTIEGEMTEIDGALLRTLIEPLSQLVRNAIVHGVETPEERLAEGKSETGAVWIRAYYAGADVIIEVGDDGRGVNGPALAARAINKGWLGEEEARTLTPKELLRLPFRPGLSGLDRAGALAGSGIGLEEVATQIRQLKGDISIVESSGHGTVFRIHAPMTLTVIESIEVRSGGQTFTAPLGTIAATLDGLADQTWLKTADSLHSAGRADGNGLAAFRLTIPDSPAVIWRDSARADARPGPGAEIPAYSLAECLGVPSEDAPTAAVIIERGGRYVGVLVNAFGAVNETMVRPLPPYLRRTLIRGVTVRAEDGAIALLLDAGALADQLLAGAARAPAVMPMRLRHSQPVARVLIVDDSVTIRRTLEQLLTRAGFATAVAGDGYEALALMEADTPRVVILDVEMPRLGGYELLGVMRSSPRYAHTRVAMLTSQAGFAHEQQARALGADEYLVKPCPQDTLIEVVTRLLNSSESA